ncbi:MAG: dihydroxyacetone kinase subunit L [Oscillospiraceae bacterium]|nr:dihydroxyacetone kinase subunit L [Oscillospiraceae bacterium]
MNRTDLDRIFEAIRDKMAQECGYLVELDARNGDGDLGLTMRDCWSAVSDAVHTAQTGDLGMVLMQCAKEANRAAPSTLGTIISFGLMGAARALRGREEVSVEVFADSLSAGIENICAKAGSKAGEKTVLDALIPAVDALKAHAGEGAAAAARAAAEAARAGAEGTRDMKSKHGRAACYGEKSLGIVDGGAIAAAMMFEAASACCCPPPPAHAAEAQR